MCKRSKNLKINSSRSGSFFDLDGKAKRLETLEKQIAKDGFWDNPQANQSILKERSSIAGRIETINKLGDDLEEAELFLEMAVEESDEGTLVEVSDQLKDLEIRIDDQTLQMMLSGTDDANNAIVSINAGAGGTEAQDWADMLFRMYLRWVERRGFKPEIVDHQPGEEAGIKSTTFTVSGENAFGYLKTESGVHRLVRISPFNASGKRHTSFASVFVYPELDDEIVIDVDEKDLRVDVFRASGAGGQHVNKTSSAVRITHMPSGIVVQCQQEKSQHRNRDLAMKVLKARLHQQEKQKQDEKLQQLHDGKDDIAWGSQIRSYVLHPYQMVKDHRTKTEKGNVNAVLDGDLDAFIEAMLLSGKNR